MDDVRAVMDAVGSERAALIGDVRGRADVDAVRRHAIRSGPSRCSSAAPRSRRTRPHDWPWGESTARGVRGVDGRVPERWGQRPASLDGFVPSRRRRSGARATWFRQAASAVGDAARGGGVHADGARDRRARRRAGDSRADADPARARGSGLPRRERPLPRRARSPGARFVELPGDDHVPWSATPTRVLAEIRGVPHRRRARRRARPRPRHRAVHRHRRLDRARRASSATAAGAICSSATTRAVRARARPLPRPRGRHRGRRLLRRLRRPGPGDPLRRGDRRRRRSALGLEIRAGVHTGECEVARRQVRRPRRPHRRAGRGSGRVRRGARVEHGAGSRRGLGDRARGPRALTLKGVDGERRLYAVA